MATTYQIENVLKSGIDYKGYKMLAFLFYFDPSFSVIEINGRNVNLFHVGVLNTDYDYYHTFSPEAWIVTLHMNYIYNGMLNENPYEFHQGLLRCGGEGLIVSPEDYANWFYLMCYVNETGYAMQEGINSTTKGLASTIYLTVNESILNPGEPILRNSKMFGLPWRSGCGDSVEIQSGYNQLISAI